MTIHQIKHRFTGAVLFECEVPDTIKSGLRTRHALEKAAAARANLADAYLADAYLAGANLARADLAGANLAGADLAGADLADADLAGAYLADADLAGAYLAGAYLADAYLAGANLAGADLAGANLAGADLARADLAGADLAGADLADAYLARADLADAYLARADLADADLAGADGPKAATNEQSIENLDKVRAIVMDDRARLQMGHWHGDPGWKSRTCAEETLCGTTHCMAGWLQVCSTDPAIRDMPAQRAGLFAAPIASKMFFRDGETAYAWLESRQYVQDTANHERRVAERKARKAAEAAGAQP